MTPTTLPPGVTAEAVQQDAMDLVAKLRPHSKMLEWALFNGPEAIVDSTIPPEKKYVELVHLVERVSALLAPLVPCKSGCSHCCKMSVVITGREALAIANEIGVRPTRPPPLRLQEEYVDLYMGVPCPFLKNTKCSIYAVRPLPCRTHFNLSAHPEVCNIIKYPGNDVPNLDFSTIWAASVAIYGEQEIYGDIREYWPNGIVQTLGE